MNRQEKVELYQDLIEAEDYIISEFEIEAKKVEGALISISKDLYKLRYEIRLDDLVTFCQTGSYPDETYEA